MCYHILLKAPRVSTRIEVQDPLNLKSETKPDLKQPSRCLNTIHKYYKDANWSHSLQLSPKLDKIRGLI
jgi:hypothetical protein